MRVVPLPDGGSLRRHVDLAGRRRLDELPDGAWLQYRYDADGHPAAVEHRDGERVDYAAGDGSWTATTDRGTTTIRLDDDGLPTAVEQCVDGIVLRAEYRPGRDGRPGAVRYPGAAAWLEVVPDGPRAVALRVGGLTYARAVATGATTTVTFANGATTIERLADGARLGSVAMTAGDGQQRSMAVTRDASGTITAVDGRRVRHDPEGRLTGVGEERWRYDAAGRLVAGPAGEIGYGRGPQAAWSATPAGRTEYGNDALGRRVEALVGAERTWYRYDLFGQLAAVERGDGDGAPVSAVEYAYDGFGRLVARDDGQAPIYQLVGIDGHRLVDVDAGGRVVASYLWLGEQCVGRVDGPLGAPLAASFHRGPTGRPLGWVDGAGVLHDEAPGDAFGAGATLAWDRPGSGGLFGDPTTGLVHAGTRWLDPAVAQFLTPDTWFGEDAAGQVPPRLRRVLDAMPGGTDCRLGPVEAYAWCRYAPLDLTDPNGHNWLGLIFSTISSLLWGMQATSASLQMWIIDFIIDLCQIIVFREVWDTDGYWERSVYNMGAPTASYRLMVPWTLWLNGVMRGPRAFTLGNVVWYSGTQLRQLEDRSARDRIVADAVATFFTATDAAAVDVLRPRNPNLLLTGTASAAVNTDITGVAVSNPAGAAIADVLTNGDAVAVRVVGATTDELQMVTTVGGTLQVAPGLPAAFGGQAVEIRRCDAGLVKLTSGDDSLARTIAFVRGSSAHIARQVPDGFFDGDDVDVEEFLPAAVRRQTNGTTVSEQLVVDLAEGAALAPYVAGDVVRILSAGTYFARGVIGTRPPASLVLDVALPTGVHNGMEVARLLPGGGVAANQAVAGARLGVTGLANLSAREGVAVTSAATVERRIVTGLVLDCTVPAVPGGLQGVQPLPVAVVRPDPTVTTDGTAGADALVSTAAGGAGKFQTGQPVEVRAGGTVVHAVIAAVDAGAETITLDANHGIAANTPISVTLMVTTAADTFTTAEAIAGAGDHVLVTVSGFGVIANGAALLIGSGGSQVVRDVSAAPVPLADLDSPLPGAFTTNLGVERLTVDAGSERQGASAPSARIRVTFGAAPPFAVNDVVHVRDRNRLPDPGEEVIDTVAEVLGNDIVLQNRTTLTLENDTVAVLLVTSTEQRGAGTLGQSKVMVPSDHGEDPYTRRDALEHHEMRHVWQYALWGPFFLSLPIPWLVHVGFSFSKFAESEQKIVRHIGLGGLDSLFALLAWGIGSREKATDVSATVGGGRKQLTLQSTDAASKVSSGYRIDVVKAGGTSEFAVVDTMAVNTAVLTLRWELPDGRFADGDTVTVTFSPFEQIRKTVSTWFSLNLENLWHDHIPSTWGRALSAVANRDSWLPGLGFYVISVIAAGGDQSRTPFEQDSAYHSGDLYTSITTSDPSTVFVGQFSRAFAFVDTRKATAGLEGDDAAGIADPKERSSVSEQLSVEARGGGASNTAVIGTVPATTAGEVRFRENWFLPLADDVGNAVGALFAASAPGTYRLHSGGELTDDGVVMAGFASVGDLETRTITVKELTITPDPAQHLLETEQVTFKVEGDSSAVYALRGAAGAAATGAVGGLAYTARVLPAGTATADDALELTATYAADHPVFRGGGQLDRDNLLAEQRTNLCQAITLAVDELTVAAPAPMAAGSTVDIETPIAPSGIDIAAPANPAQVTGALRIMNLGGRPGRLQVLAPAAVTVDVDFNVTLRFGTDPDPDPTRHKAVPITIRVTP